VITHHRTRRPERDVQDRNLATKSQFRDEVTSLDSNTIAITSQLTRSHNPQATSHKGAIVDGAPKWQSHRTIAAPRALMDLLSEHLRLRGLSGEDPDPYVFVAKDGRELHYSNWRQRVWVPALKSAGHEGLTFHPLRPANATAMVALSVDIKTAQVRVGHKWASTLLDIYAQATTAGDRRAADELGRHFFSDEDGGQGCRDNGHAG